MLSALWSMFWNDGTATTTGVAATSAVGVPSAIGDANVVITGVEAVASVGALTGVVTPEESPPLLIGVLGGTGFYPPPVRIEIRPHEVSLECGAQQQFQVSAWNTRNR